ncbi:MAG TPA: YbhB/YbcL family Raf kinase inhibitor-like protein, partial [Phenylobacterium sp.]|nr:YbhB/YbcL family Raf kinase inhibitor-like protein [Phenylobacterium sp.]
VAQAPPPPAVEPGIGYLALTLLPAKGDAKLKVTSPAFGDMADIPFENTQYRGNIFPGLAWSKGPAATKSYVVIMQDTDGVRNSDAILHWTMYNIAPTTTKLDAGLTTPPAGAQFGPNIRALTQSYMGPRTPPGPKHRYHMQVFALDTRLADAPPLTWDGLKAALAGHVLASGQVVGLGQADPTAAAPATPK